MHILLQVAVFRMQPQQGGGLYSPESASRRKSASSEKVLVQSVPNLLQLALEESLRYATQQTSLCCSAKLSQDAFRVCSCTYLHCMTSPLCDWCSCGIWCFRLYPCCCFAIRLVPQALQHLPHPPPPAAEQAQSAAERAVSLTQLLSWVSSGLV